MFSSRLLPSSTGIAQYLKCSPTFRIPLAQQFCCIRTEGIVPRSIIVERKSSAERKINSKKKKKQQKKGVVPLTIRANRGVGHLLSAIAEETGSEYLDDRNLDENLDLVSEEFDEERNFFDASEDFNQIAREGVSHRHKLSYQITKQKYFKPPVEPNFLTYAEKHHIKFLHDDEQNKWTVDSLARSYPATPEIIKKILKTKWKVKSAEEVLRHDAAVEKNWQAFKKGELNVFSEDLKKHLKRFPNRVIKVPTLTEAEKYVVQIKKKVRRINEFSNIIESYRALNAHDASNSTTLIGKSIFDDELKKTRKSESTNEYNSTRLEGKEPGRYIEETDPTNRRAKHFTLDKFKKTLELDNKWKEEVGNLDKQIISSDKKFSGNFEMSDVVDEESDDGKITLSLSTEDRNETTARRVETKDRNAMDEIDLVKKSDNKLVTKLYDKNLAKELNIVEFIKIPKHLRRDGCLYKVKDCFYSDDGHFLYRVPGLKS